MTADMPSLREHPVVKRAIRLNERYGEDAGGYLAASIAYYAFLSLFPLLLLAFSVVGFVLASNPAVRDEVSETVAGSIPGLRAIVGRNLAALENSRAGAGVIGLAGLLWTGTGVAASGRNALRRVFRAGPPVGGFADKARLVALTAGLGLVALGATTLGGMAARVQADGVIGVVLRVGSAGVSLGLDVALFALAYRTLVRRGMTWRQILPGAIFAAIGWTLLKIFGTWYATRTVEGSESVYGTFAAAIGVLVILYLAARLFVYGAELNAVLIEERGGGPMETESGDGRTSRPGEVSTIRLVGQVAGDVGTLVKKEVELARQEIMEAVTSRLKGAAVFAAIGVIAMFIVGFLAAAGAAALDLVLPTWAALLIVAGVFVIIAILAFLVGRRLLKQPPMAPEQTKKTIKEDVEWAKAQLRR
ncbi:MAG: YihY family inner membrane protein [Actinomycetota bacterium]|nr:YihY family inner membrane protein [Actinomycetota bacterium]